MEELRQHFFNAINRSIEESKNLGYEPTIFLQMIQNKHPVEVVKRLVISGDMQTGFTNLIQLGRPELTIESILLEERFTTLFTNQEREAARWRLNQANQLKL